MASGLYVRPATKMIYFVGVVFSCGVFGVALFKVVVCHQCVMNYRFRVNAFAFACLMFDAGPKVERNEAHALRAAKYTMRLRCTRHKFLIAGLFK